MTKLRDVKLCVGCDELVEVALNQCPSCTCSQFFLLSRFEFPRNLKADELQRCVVTIKPAPPAMNTLKGHHWSKYAAVRKTMIKEAGWQLKSQMKYWPKPPVRVKVLRCAQKEMDPGGVIESLKPVVDCMVDVGLVPEDTAEFVRYGDPAHKTISPGQITELIVTIVNDEDWSQVESINRKEIEEVEEEKTNEKE